MGVAFEVAVHEGVDGRRAHARFSTVMEPAADRGTDEAGEMGSSRRHSSAFSQFVAAHGIRRYHTNAVTTGMTELHPTNTIVWSKVAEPDDGGQVP